MWKGRRHRPSRRGARAVALALAIVAAPSRIAAKEGDSGIEAFAGAGEATAAALAVQSEAAGVFEAERGRAAEVVLTDPAVDGARLANATSHGGSVSMPLASTLSAAHTQRGSPGWRDATPDVRQPGDANRLLNTSAGLRFGANELLLSRQVLDLNYPRPPNVRMNRADATYLGRSNDLRMAAMAYEAALVAGRPSASLRYYGGYVAGAKTLTASRSASMAELFGTSGGGGMWLGGLQWSPSPGLWLQSFYHQVDGTLSIGYADADYVRRFSRDSYARLGAQYSVQQAPAEDRGERSFSTFNSGMYGEIGWYGLATYAAWSGTGAGGDLRRPLSAGPIYTVMAARDFARAGENAVLVGAAFDLARIMDMRGLSLDFTMAEGRGALNAASGIELPGLREYDASLAYAFGKATRLAGARLQARFVRVEEELPGSRTDAIRINVALPVSFL